MRANTIFDRFFSKVVDEPEPGDFAALVMIALQDATPHHQIRILEDRLAVEISSGSSVRELDLQESYVRFTTGDPNQKRALIDGLVAGVAATDTSPRQTPSGQSNPQEQTGPDIDSSPTAIIEPGSESGSPDGLLGSVVGHVRLTELLGQGGMGTVYLGVDETLDRKVAVKALRKDVGLDRLARERFLREARLLSKLEHPNICRIYDIVEDEKGDFLILELVDGMTLDRAITRGIEPAQALDIALQLAKTLSTAHALGVVHRDLKPENVMLTGNGEVRVLDFGLGRSMDDELRSTLVTDNPTASNPALGQTRIGTIMGTVGYMSPEQARGEVVCQASDVYSLGLLLQQLFTSKTPFDRKASAAELLQHAMAGKSEAVEGLSSPLTSLLDDMKGLDVDKRPTGTAVATELQRIRRIPRQRARRIALVLVVVLAAASAAKYTFDLRRERTRALTAEAEALDARDDAEALVGFMLDDLYRELEPVGRLDLLKDVSRQALSYYDPGETERLEPAALKQRAIALTHMGDILRDQGELDGANESFSRASVIAEELSRNSDDTTARFIHAQALAGLGSVHMKRDETTQGTTLYNQAIEIGELALSEAPDNVRWIQSFSHVYSDVRKFAYISGDLDLALESAHKAVRLGEHALQLKPGDLNLMSDVGFHLGSLGQIINGLGRPDEAILHLQREIELGEQVRLARPSDAKGARLVRDANMEIGFIHHEGGRERDAESALLVSAELGRELVSRDPSNAQHQVVLSTVYDVLGEVYLSRGEKKQALDSFLQALALMERLAVVDSSDLWIQSDRAFELIQVGRARQELGDRGGATDAFRRAVKILEPLSDSNTMAILDNLARALLYLGRGDEARPVVERLFNSDFLREPELLRLCRENGLIDGNEP